MTHVVDRPTPEPQRPAKQRKAKKQSKLAVILTIIGFLIILYPVVATVIENNRQSGQVEAYTQRQAEFSEEELAEAVARAHEWNDVHQNGPMLDPWLARVAEDNEEYQEYLNQLNLTEVMGRVSIPSINSDLPIYHGTTEEVLKKGIGHLYGSALPVGGEGKHTVLTGHTGLSTSTLWDNLTDVKVGDAVYIDAHGQKMKYEVRDIQVVLPNETDSLRPVADKDMLTLITCTPYAVNSHRLLVHAERVPMDEEESRQIFDSVRTPWQSWMTWVLVFAALIAAWIVLEWWVKKKRRQQEEEGQTQESQDHND
ncbi:class C sortase [Corynebacterium lizhenjunii]|uniref:Class C sortase n=1 Tax=Corynebacterium lizhenjunii TaxID=2709394 RepID=A0A7T0PCA4_9CORY|nr:class C sortase [Corynebacterium lizhenjunii]QPK79512.1 class C sortase [Corynebacterium lizhenjunii]